MGYIFIYILIHPLFWILSPFRKRRGGYLVIQSAKIGDYINTTVLFAALKKVDVAIDSKNLPFAQHDTRVKKVYLLDKNKYSLSKKIGLAFKLYLHGYEAVFTPMPNSFNLFLSKCSHALIKRTLVTYASKWYEKLLMIGMDKIRHSKEDLTIKSYLTMYKDEPNITLYPKKPFEPMFVPENIVIEHSPNFKVGITLGAGNRIKVMPTDVWLEVLNILDQNITEVYVFGTSEDEMLLQELESWADFKNLKLFSLLGQLKTDELPYHISNLDMFISSDTGLCYIADCYDVPLINFAGPCYMPEQRPTGKNVLIVESHVECVPFHFVFAPARKMPCEDIYTITKEQVNLMADFIERLQAE